MNHFRRNFRRIHLLGICSIFVQAPPIFAKLLFSLAILGGTQGRTRTDTLLRAGDFESPASTIPPLGPII